MTGRTGIEWTDRTWNPVVGCTKVSQGCKLCYAKTLHDMRHKARLEGKAIAPQYAQPFETVQLMPDRLGWPLSLRQPSRIFVNSVSDLFHDDVPDEFIVRVFATMAVARHHVFQILTKRPERMQGLLNNPDFAVELCKTIRSVQKDRDIKWMTWPLPNVWLGVSVEHQAAAEERIPHLLHAPAAVRFLSCEPLLGPVDLLRLADDEVGAVWNALEMGIGWVIVGGESGLARQDPRPMHPDWATSLRDQCVAAGVPFLFKQWGDFANEVVEGTEPDLRELAANQLVACGDGMTNHVRFTRVGKKRAGRELDGRTWDQYPTARS